MRKMGRVSTTEAATRACASGATVRGWVKQKKIKAVYYCANWWIDVSSLDAFLKDVF